MTSTLWHSALDEQWLDFYTLLEVEPTASEDEIRRRIGQVYSQASANTGHRDLKLRHYYEALVERVLPQARRVLLDPAWRARYDEQRALHTSGEDGARPFVSFVAGMRGADVSQGGDADWSRLPSRVQDEIQAARAAVECAHNGLQLDLLPSNTLIEANLPSKRETAPAPAQPTQVAPKVEATAPATQEAPKSVKAQAAPVEELQPQGEPVRLQTLTAEEARELRRRGLNAAPVVAPAPVVPSTPVAAPAVAPAVAPSVHERISGDVVIPHGRKFRRRTERVAVAAERRPKRAVLSPTSLHLLVAITGVMLTLSIQRFAAQPASAMGLERTPILVAASPEMAGVLGRASEAWERTPSGNAFDVVVSNGEGEAGVRRALGRGAQAPDVWMPSSRAWLDRYNSLAGSEKREPLASSQSLGSTPIVLLASAAHADELEKRFPDHQISSWSALRDAVTTDARGRFGLCDPENTSVGALVRFSIAREWAEAHGQTPASVLKSSAFWSWMSGFENQTPSAYATTDALVSDLLAGEGSRAWWGLAYESDALAAMRAGHDVKVWYLPRTLLADHPLAEVERVGASAEVNAGRAALERFLRSDEGQKSLLLAGMRPVGLSLNAKVKGNPFADSSLQKRGIRTALPRDERSAGALLSTIAGEWAKRFK